MSRMRPSLPARFCLGLITLYRYTLSPFIGGHCRYLPTCSHYAADAARAHGAWAGSWMALARLCRCRPGGARGYDPAPAGLPNAHWWAPWDYGDWRGPIPSVSFADSSPLLDRLRSKSSKEGPVAGGGGASEQRHSDAA